jgi:uncharacterized protein (DUF885 family)
MKSLKVSLLLLAGAAGIIGGCAQQESSTQSVYEASSQAQAQMFKQATDQFIDDLWLQSPGWAMWAGYHKYDHVLIIPNQASRDKDLAFVEKQRQRFNQFNLSSLSDNEKTDHYLINNFLDSMHWSQTQMKSYQWVPSQYNVAGGFARIINGTYDTLDNRLATFLTRAENIPQYYQAAIDNITIPTMEHTELAIVQNKGALAVFSDDLLKKVADSGLTAPQKALFKTRVADAKTAINGYIAFLQDLTLQLKSNGNARSFRLGSKLYTQKFAYDIQSSYSAKEIYQKAKQDKNDVLIKMAKLADQLWPKYFADKPRPTDDNQAISELIEHISVKHVKRENFVEEIRNQIPALEAFIKDKDLIHVDSEKPLVVRETPQYMRGVAGASISSPGPYEKKANTYYNVTPLGDMSDEQAESYLREYNHWLLQILNIHEAIPGHYTQLVYSNESPSLIKAILGNGAMVEGWAVYTERMMLEEGYGDFEPELWLMYYKWNLRVISNTILDYAVHNLDMSKAQALDLLMGQAFQEKTEAQGKWRRVTLSQVQLTSYYSGYREIYDFRQSLKAKQGDNFNLRAFHEKFLSYGSAPVKYVKQLMAK